MLNDPEVLYTASATAVGGREGRVESSDGILRLELRVPVAMGGPGRATNPEQLFAAGYAACFQQALGVAGRRRGIDTSTSYVSCEVSLAKVGGAYHLGASLAVSLPGTDPDVVQELVDAAHRVCPYSNATRGNIAVSVSVVEAAQSGA